MKQAVEHLAELPTYASDGAPDVFIFTFSTLRVSLLLELTIYIEGKKITLDSYINPTTFSISRHITDAALSHMTLSDAILT